MRGLRGSQNLNHSGGSKKGSCTSCIDYLLRHRGPGGNSYSVGQQQEHRKRDHAPSRGERGIRHIVVQRAFEKQ